MYPRAFDYVAPTNREEVLDVLAERGSEVKILAGGQSLIPMMKLRFASPETLVDINRLPGLDYIDETNGNLRIGALVRHNDIVRSELVSAHNHTMAAAAPWIADPIVRNLGTVCGSIAHHDPEGDWASVMLASNAEVVVTSKPHEAHFHPGAEGTVAAGGERVVPIQEFLVDMFTTSLRPEEMVIELRVPKHGPRAGGDYQKLERKIGDYATVGVATSLELDDSGRISNAGIALTSVYAFNLKVHEAESLLYGQEPSEELFAEAAQIATRSCDPTSDVRGSAEYKRDVVRVFTERGLAKSLAMAQAG